MNPLVTNTGLLMLLGIGAVVGLIVFLIVWAVRSSGHLWEAPERRVGRQGEQIAFNEIRAVLRDGDSLYTNVALSYEGKPAELDAVVVNQNGVFIFEVKYYNGTLYGRAEDYAWTKRHISRAGIPYDKQVKNPIRQVKREVYILANDLRNHGANAWVTGYAIVLNAAPPVQDPCLLADQWAVDFAIHSPGKRPLSPAQLYAVNERLSFLATQSQIIQ